MVGRGPGLVFLSMKLPLTVRLSSSPRCRVGLLLYVGSSTGFLIDSECQLPAAVVFLSKPKVYPPVDTRANSYFKT